MTKRKFIKIAAVLLSCCVLVILSSCGTEPPASEVWWTKADTLAVDEVLTLWRDTISGYNPIRSATYACEMNIPLTLSDTAPRSAYTVQIKKIAHLTGFDYTPIERPQITQYTFGRKNDSIMTRDTFCYLTYRDSSNCITSLHYDSIWTITFNPDTQIILPDTIITYRVSSVTKTYFDAMQSENHFDYQTIRYLELKKDSAELIYRFKYMSGFGAYLPDNTTAPVISNIILTKQTGQCDTFRYGTRTDRKGLLNLVNKDSLYALENNQSVNLQVTLTGSDQYYVFISTGTPQTSNKQLLTVTSNIANTSLNFTQNGIHHLYVEVIPGSALFYPDNPWKTTIWALPVRITSQ